MRLAASVIDKAKRTIEVSSGRTVDLKGTILYLYLPYRILEKRNPNRRHLSPRQFYLQLNRIPAVRKRQYH